jgi:hypothetical protein
MSPRTITHATIICALVVTGNIFGVDGRIGSAYGGGTCGDYRNFLHSESIQPQSQRNVSFPWRPFSTHFPTIFFLEITVAFAPVVDAYAAAHLSITTQKPLCCQENNTYNLTLLPRKPHLKRQAHGLGDLSIFLMFGPMLTAGVCIATVHKLVPLALWCVGWAF